MPRTDPSSDRVLIGCCGFPVARARCYRELELVEVQQTFYEPPSPSVAARWRAEAPSGFTFTLKAWQLITHPPSSPTYRRLRSPLTGPADAYGRFRPSPEVMAAWERTLEVAVALEAPIVVFQCPPSFAPGPESLENLRAFFGRVERGGLTFVWEPRGAWPDPVVAALCRELDLVHGVDPLVARELAGGIAYFRLHGIGGYRYRYTEADLYRLRQRCREAAEAGRRPVHVLFNNLGMLDAAREFAALLGQPG
ncbi:MAG TPA: DUF72 domain-containing protein [Candidatus Dormibacteraeota bacterium]|jgi:uncharacterized protein YecE (DUF72 family)|nr:DUF72 domain-containing protein [Candidatus Dormibacteraeota bacterium]